MQTTIDTSALDKAIAIYKRARLNKTYSYCVNRALQNVTARAIGPTPKADGNRIAWIMGQVGTQIAYTDRKGRLKRYKTPKRVYDFANSFAARIINKRRKTVGKELLFGAEMDKEARKMVGARLRSVAFIKSGYLPALKLLSRLIDKPLRILKEGRVVGVDKGWAIAAPKGTAVTVGEVANNAKGASKVGFAAAQKAVLDTAADMTKWATEQHVKEARKAGFRAS